jgi:DNA repair exonuclease SbcCD ATPase subunit
MPTNIFENFQTLFENITDNLIKKSDEINVAVENINSNISSNINSNSYMYYINPLKSNELIYKLKSNTPLELKDNEILDFQNKWIYIDSLDDSYVGFIKSLVTDKSKIPTICNLNVYINGNIGVAGGGIILANQRFINIKNCNVYISGNIDNSAGNICGMNISYSNGCNLYDQYIEDKVYTDATVEIMEEKLATEIKKTKKTKTKQKLKEVETEIAEIKHKIATEIEAKSKKIKSKKTKITKIKQKLEAMKTKTKIKIKTLKVEAKAQLKIKIEEIKEIKQKLKEVETEITEIKQKLEPLML